MLKKAVLFVFLVFTMVSCQFTETMVIYEDGSGRMAIELNLDEMMAFGAMGMDSTVTKMDTLISMREFIEEHKDSISKLPIEDQQKMKMMESYTIHMFIDSEASKMQMDMYTDFKNVSEANNLFDGFGNASSAMPNMGNDMTFKKDDSSSDIVGVTYNYANGVFKRDAYIKDKEKYKVQMDSLKSAEAFMSSMQYTLKYTFPKKIVKSSIEDATFSLDGKTIKVERGFIDYMKDPNVLDLEVELEK